MKKKLKRRFTLKQVRWWIFNFGCKVYYRNREDINFEVEYEKYLKLKKLK